LVALFVELAIDITTIVVAIGESLQEVDHHSEVYLFFRDGEHFQKVYVFIICPPHDRWYVEVYVNSILDFLDDWVCESSDLVSCTWSLCQRIQPSRL
jgi:hypothetical protein